MKPISYMPVDFLNAVASQSCLVTIHIPLKNTRVFLHCWLTSSGHLWILSL